MMPPFEALSFHDNLIHGLHLRCPDPDRGDWASDLVLDIDHIVEWLCCGDSGTSFQVVAATLAFHDVGSLCIAVDYPAGWGDSLTEMSIDRIERSPQPVDEPNLRLVRRRYAIALNVPQGGSIGFLASGLTLHRRGPVHRTDQQWLPRDLRPPLAI